ncbi:MAG: TRAP transporter small permease subunit [Pseudomonadota bacterium]
MRPVLTLLRQASHLPVALACTALFVLMVMTFSDVVLRSAANAPIEAATEITRILMAIIVFSVMPVISARGGHIAVDLTDPVFARYRLGRWRDAAIHLAAGLMLIYPVRQIWVLAERARGFGDVTEYLAIPQFYIGWFIALFAGATALVLIGLGLLHLFAPKMLRPA